ncbi:type II secretion system F family protein [Nocardiopsis sp. RSe5-2]|uniref:Type II secretion system F family protein n=1 Tax=Nocardiopsis endophytica TaxID=3018445 RepID=A0ABT4U2G3_9ACTN|nr:type II secretion system F family protein [Nocardiopsis endophytica]MDA2811138.1 type II secretion system F family protein [Nocardiopsis endophytica]
MSLDVLALLLAALTLLIGVWGFREWGVGTMERRDLASRGMEGELDRRHRSPLARMDRMLRNADFGVKLERRLRTAGLEMKLSTFVMITVVASIVAVVFLWNALAPIFGIVAIFGVVAGIFGYLKRQEERRKEAFTAQLPELARVLSNATQAGLALPTAIDMAAEELDDPAGAELRLTARSIQLGQPFEEAISDLRDRMPSREIGVLISTLLVSSRSGGALVTSLRNISTTLESRKETRREVKTILGEATSTAYALLVMGIGSFFLINTLMPGAVATMAQSNIGLAIILVSLTLFAVGFVAVLRMSKLDF